MSGENVVAAETAKVFSDYHVYLASLNVIYHPPKRRTIKRGSTKSIINIGIIHGKPVLRDELIKQ